MIINVAEEELSKNWYSVGKQSRLLVEFSMQPFEGRVHHGGNASETAAAAMQLQRKIVRGRMHFCSFPPLFFSPPPPIISILTQSSIATDIVPCLRDSGRFLHESVIEELQKRIRGWKMYILRFRCNFFRFLRGIKRGIGGSTRLDNDTNGKDGRRSTFHRVLFDPPRPCVPFYEIESKKKGKMSPMTARLGVTKPPKNSA